MNFDLVAIEKLEETFLLQKAAYLIDPDPSLEARLDLLSRIGPMMMENQGRIVEALNSDYGHHSDLTAIMFDVLNVVERSVYVMEHLPQWMQRDSRELDSRIYGSSEAYIRHQPKGVVGNLVAWNFPVDIAIGPLIEMLAAGNRVIMKPSEQTPAVGEVLADMIESTFSREQVWVANGGLDLARHFSRLNWDHLLYTGNARVGREVMRNAAENLVPVTLELGGKNPTVFTEESVRPEHIRTMLGTKLTKNGQLCIGVDHVYVPEEQADTLIEGIQSQIEALMGDYTNSPLNCAVINARQMDRLARYVDDAKGKCERIVELGSPASTDGYCRMPFTIVLNPSADALVSQEEMFGPILPVTTYKDFDSVVAQIQSGERPLGIYIYSDQPERIEQLRSSTSSGGFAVNCASLQGAQASLGFGGSGESGMGRHHGIEGFHEFSNPRGYFELAGDANLEPLCSPHGKATEAFIKSLVGS